MPEALANTGPDPFTGITYDKTAAPSATELTGNVAIDMADATNFVTATIKSPERANIKLNGVGATNTVEYNVGSVTCDLSNLNSLYLTGTGRFFESKGIHFPGPKTIYIQGAQFVINPWAGEWAPMSLSSDFVLGPSPNAESGSTLYINKPVSTSGNLTLKGDVTIHLRKDTRDAGTLSVNRIEGSGCTLNFIQDGNSTFTPRLIIKHGGVLKRINIAKGIQTYLLSSVAEGDLELSFMGKRWSAPTRYSDGVLYFDWPAELPIHGAITADGATTDSKFTIPLNITYPVKKVAQLLRDDTLVYELLEKTELTDNFFFADSNEEAIGIVVLALCKYMGYV